MGVSELHDLLAASGWAPCRLVYFSTLPYSLSEQAACLKPASVPHLPLAMISKENTGIEFLCAVFAAAETPVQPGKRKWT